MDPARWQRLRPWLDRLLDLDADARAKLLASLPDAAADLHGDLVDLLAEHDVAATIDHGAAALAAPVLAASEAATHDHEGERVGQQIGPYRVKRLLGSGGMGAVYLAEREESGFVQRVALKVVRVTLKGGGARERFDRERRILAELKHPNIAQLFDGGTTDDGAPYYTMEFVDGMPISEFCRAYPGDVALCVRLMLKVASALAHAHQRLIIHRDIKPSNIMVTGEQHVKLLDFGIAKPLFAPIGASLTRGAVGPMTPEYAAPEQFRGGAITVATDIYQFGVLLYRLLTGRFPYDADPADTLGWARAVTEQEPIALMRALSLTRRRSRDPHSDSISRPGFDAKHLRRWLSGDLDAIVRMTLAKRPDDRYRSMDALISDMEAFLRGDPVSARRASAGYRARRFIARHKVAVATAALSSFALIGVTIYALNEATRARAEATRAHDAMQFVGDLFLRIDPLQGGSRELKAETLLAYAAEQLDRDGIRDPNLRGRLELMIGKGFVALGDSANARQRFEPVIRELRKHPQADPLLLAELLDRAALSVHRNGRTAEAEQMLAEAERLTGAVSAQNVDVLVRVYTSRATLAIERANAVEALPLAQRALDWSIAFDPAGGSDRTATAQTKLARILRSLNRYDEGIESAQRARNWYVRRYGENDLRTVLSDEMIGWIMVATDRFADAEPILESAGARMLEVAGHDSVAYANNAYDRALLYRKLGRERRASDAFAESARIFEVTGGKESVERGWSVWNYGRSALLLGEFAAAVTAIEEAESIFAHNSKVLTPARVNVWINLVEAWLVGNQAQRALDAADDYLRQIRAAGMIERDAMALLPALRSAAATELGDAELATSMRTLAMAEADRVADDARDRSSLQRQIDRLSSLRSGKLVPPAN